MTASSPTASMALATTRMTVSVVTSVLEIVQEDERLAAADGRLERLVDPWIDRCADEVAHTLHRLLGRHLLLVGARGGERVVDLDRADDAGAERNGLAGEAVGVAEAVPALVVAP